MRGAVNTIQLLEIIIYTLIRDSVRLYHFFREMCWPPWHTAVADSARQFASAFVRVPALRNSYT